MGADALSELAARLRAIPTLGAAIAAEAAPSCQAIAKATAAAGTTPEGAPWAPRKKDGARALVNAADAVTARPEGATVVLVLSGVNVYHQKTRRILPDPNVGIPPQYREAILAAAGRVIGRAV